MKKLFICLIVTLNIVSAQTDSLKVFRLKPITITASKYEQSIRTLSSSVSILPNSEVVQNVKSSLVSSLSTRVPGLFLTERGIGGYGISNSSGKISVRGISGVQQVLLVVDGRPEFAGIFGHPVVDNYQSSEIEAVDVIRGPASVLFGSNAMGGVINISTKRNHTDGISYTGELNYGSYNSRKLNGGVGYKKDNFTANLSINNDFTDDSRPSSSYNSSTGSFNASYSFNPAWGIDLNSYINTTKAYNPGTVTSPFINNSAWTDVTRANASLTLRNKLDNSEGAATVMFNNGVHDVYDGFHSSDQMFGVLIHQGFTLFENNVTTFGGEIKNYGGSARNKAPMIDTTVTESAAYVAVNQKLNKDFSVNGGLRINNHSVYGTEIIPQLNIQYSILDGTALNISAAKGFRSPTLSELFLFGANVNLKPERLWNYELGIKQKLLSNKLLLDLTGFLIEGNDFVVMTGSYPKLLNQNLKSIRNRGLEFEAKYLATNNFSVNANYSYLNMDTKIVGAPEHQIFVEANLSLGAFYINLNMKAISNLLTVPAAGNQSEKNQSYSLLNGALWYKPLRQITLYLKADNLLDRKYEIIDGYPMPGTTMRLGFTFNGNL